MRQFQALPRNRFNLYGALVAKEIELARKNQGTFHRSASKLKDRAKWTHSNCPGWIKIARGMGDVVVFEIRSRKDGAEWQLLRAILGFLDWHFGGQIQAINIQCETASAEA